jgi:uracil-DNA glycosylase
MKIELEIDSFKQKIFEKLQPSGWGTVFKSYIFSSDFEELLARLYRMSSSGERFTPGLKDVFRAFEECPYDELKLVVVGQDPYPTLGVADGIAFSCSKTNALQPSLRYMLDEINRTIYNGEQLSTDVDLTRWSNQGMLMLNTSLTTEVGKIGKHYHVWEGFVGFLFDHLNHNKKELTYLYLGKKAQEWAEYVGDNNHKVFASHPASAAYNKQKEWNSDGAFLKAQQLVAETTGYTIHW